MPDPTLATLSATESPALFGVSPYVTKWMLWCRFAKGIDISEPENERMSWGKKLQPLVLAQAAEDLRLEVIPNKDDDYKRRGLLGCTTDALIICPDRGPGALETKCIFDYMTWMRDMDGGKTLPKPHEIQLQQQMYVGDEKTPFTWGVIAVWVSGDMHYFEREPIADLWSLLEKEAAQFFDEVKAGKEPDPFGVPVEVPLLSKLFAPKAGKVLELESATGVNDFLTAARLYKQASADESAAKKMKDTLKPKLLAWMKDADEARLPGQVRVKNSRRAVKGGTYTRKDSVSAQIKVYVPDDHDELLDAEMEGA